ncbi:MAG: replicative DNA helicase [bacterium]|nr:replicative DNA helicase [bacterium]
MNNIPPQNIELEQSILSSCLINTESLDDIADILIPNDFYKTSHQKIYSAMLELKRKSEPVDIVMLVDKLKILKQLELIGGASYLAVLIDTPVAINIEYTVKKIKQYAVLRNTIDICYKTIQSCQEASGDTDEIVDKFQTDILRIDTGISGDNYIDMKQLAVEGEDRHEIIYNNQTNVSGVASGFIDIDKVTCGFQPGDLIIIAARPSMGKSSLMRNMAVNMAKKEIPNAIISLEMSKEQLYDSLSASESGVSLMKFRNGWFSMDDWRLKTEAASRLYELKMFVADKDCFKTLDICRIARRLKKKEDIKIVFIDYLQLIEGDTKKGKNYEVGEITRRFKQLAKELEITVVLLSQLNRDCEKRPDKRPVLSDLRDSGSIEQDADVVMFPYRREQYIMNKYHDDGTMTPDMIKWHGKAELNIAKQRMGPTRRINLIWLDKTVQFKDAVKDLK